jgi:F-type H+-transporting ATPase subunit b
MNVALMLAVEGEPTGLGVILPATAELVYGLISFVIVFVVLSKLVFPRLGTMLEERREAIQGRMEAAEAKLAEADKAKREYEASISDAKGEANRIIEEAKQQAEQVRADILRRAEDEATAVRERAQVDAAAERDRTLQELRGEVGAMSVQLASKIVEKELDPAAHAALVDSYISGLNRNN